MDIRKIQYVYVYMCAVMNSFKKWSWIWKRVEKGEWEGGEMMQLNYNLKKKIIK